MEHNKPDFTLLEYITKKLKLIESKEACSTLAEEIYELESKIGYIYENRKGNKFFNEFIKEYKLMINKYKIDKCY